MLPRSCGVSGCQDAKFQTGIETGAVGAGRIANWKGPQDKTKFFFSRWNHLNTWRIGCMDMFLPFLVGQGKTKDTVLASNLVEPRFGVCIHLKQPDKDALFSTQKGHQWFVCSDQQNHQLAKVTESRWISWGKTAKLSPGEASSRSLSPWPPHGLREKVSSKLLYLKSWQPFPKHEKDLRAHKRCYKRSHENLPLYTGWVLRDFWPGIQIASNCHKRKPV